VKTAKKLWAKISNISCKKYTSDEWSPYTKILPNEKHIVGKAHTHNIESFNCNVRHYLARFRRKTRCYSKCKIMVEASLNLLF
jgi:insertion element IS1 protein InsB